MQYANRSVEDGAGVRRAHIACDVLAITLCARVFYIPSLQIRARRGHLWRVTSAEGEGSSLPHPYPLDRLKKHGDPHTRDAVI